MNPQQPAPANPGPAEERESTMLDQRRQTHRRPGPVSASGTKDAGPKGPETKLDTSRWATRRRTTDGGAAHIGGPTPHRALRFTLLAALVSLLLGPHVSLQAQVNYNPNNYDSANIIEEMRHPHKDLVMITAHRGEHFLYQSLNDPYAVPELSLPSIWRAAEDGAELIELDVKLTSDGVPILAHDQTWGRMTYCTTPSNGCGVGVTAEFDAFGPNTPANQKLNPTVGSLTAAQTKQLSLRNFPASSNETGEVPATLQDALNDIRELKIASVLALDIKDDRTAQAAWQVVKANNDYKGNPFSQSVVFKMNGAIYPNAESFQQAFGADYQSVLLWALYGTADIRPSKPVGTYAEDDDYVDAQGFGSEAGIISAINSLRAYVPGLVATEVNRKQNGGILSSVLSSAMTYPDGSAASVGSFRPLTEYETTATGAAQFFQSKGDVSGYCCYTLRDVFYDGSQYGQPSDTEDDRGDLSFLLFVNGDNIITTDDPVSDIHTLTSLGLRNISYLQDSTGTGTGGGGTGTGGGGTTGSLALRLLPLGDSITYGQYSSTGNGYREFLRSELASDGFSTDMVGDNTDGDMYDNYNEGWPGYFISSVNSFIGAPLGKWRPNVITMMLGTNDMDHGSTAGGTDPAGAPGRLGTMIDDIFTKAPDATLLVATLTPSTHSDVEGRIQTFNQQVPGIVQARAGQGKHVALVDMSAVTTDDIGTDPGNWLHPHDSGYQKMADAFHQAIKEAVAKGWVSAPIDCSSIGGGCSDPAIKAGGEPVGTDPNPVASSVGGKPAPSGGVGTSSSGSGSGTNQKVRYADFDGDGKADYIVVSNTGGLTVWYNRGGNIGGGFDGPHQVANGLAPSDEVQLADFDGDGRVDYIVVLPSGEVTVQLNRGGDGNGGWLDLGHVANGTGPASQTRFADLDGDGKADYLQVSPTGGVSVWFNNGGDGRGGWNCACQIANGVAPSANVQFADFDGDGKDDYIVVADDGSVDVWLNKGGNGSGGWQETGKLANGVAPGNQVIFADFDGDGRADYLVVQQSTGETEAWLNRGGDGRSLTGWVPQGFVAFGIGAAGNQVTFADLNGDHRADYLVLDDPSTGKYDAWLNAGGGTWNAQGTIAYGVGKQATDQVLFGDVNGDGTADYMVIPFPGTTGKAYYYASDYAATHTWTFTDESARSFQPVTTGIDGKEDRTVLVDLTNSGKADLATIHGAGGAVTAMFNQVDPHGPTDAGAPDWVAGTPQTPYNVATGVGYPGSQVWLADIDGDGKADYVAVDNIGGVHVYTNESGGGVWTFSQPIRIPGRIDCKSPGFTTPDFNYTQFADLDGDGRADYLCIERDNGAVRAWRNVDLNHGSTTGWLSVGKVANGVGVQ